MEKITRNDAEILEPLYRAGIRPGINWQKELTELIIDIAFRENISCLEVLKVPQIQTVLNHKKLSSPQKLEKVKDLLFARRYPTIFLARKVFNQELKKLKISPKIKVKYHPFFEDEKLTVEISTPNCHPERSEGSLVILTIGPEIPRRLASRNDIKDNEILESLTKLKGADLVKNALKIAEDNS